jgi:hypothetical protein
MSTATTNHALITVGTVAALVSACLVTNPSYSNGESDDAATTALSSGDTTGDTTADNTSVATTSGDDSEGATTQGTGSTGVTGSGTTETTGPTTTDGATTDPSTTDGATTDPSTTGADPGEYILTPTLVACVFFANQNAGHGAPQVCEANADQQNGPSLTGLIQIDNAVNYSGGQGRRAESYFIFPIPDDFAGLTVTAAELFVRAADISFPKPTTGELWRAEPFNETDLAQGHPTADTKLVADLGPHMANQWVQWSIPADQLSIIKAGEPLHLALRPTGNDGLFYRGATTQNGPPYLKIILE